jgi:hypothetical protein
MNFSIKTVQLPAEFSGLNMKEYHLGNAKVALSLEENSWINRIRCFR